jgi:hypothetical protein
MRSVNFVAALLSTSAMHVDDGACGHAATGEQGKFAPPLLLLLLLLPLVLLALLLLALVLALLLALLTALVALLPPLPPPPDVEEDVP